MVNWLHHFLKTMTSKRHKILLFSKVSVTKEIQEYIGICPVFFGPFVEINWSDKISYAVNSVFSILGLQKYAFLK